MRFNPGHAWPTHPEVFVGLAKQRGLAIMPRVHEADAVLVAVPPTSTSSVVGDGMVRRSAEVAGSR